MTLLDLLTGICFLMPLGCAISTAHRAHVGLWGWILELAVALVLGAAFGVSIWFVIEYAGRWIIAQSKAKQTLSGILLFVTIFGWIAGAGFTGDWVSRSLLRLLA